MFCCPVTDVRATAEVGFPRASLLERLRGLLPWRRASGEERRIWRATQLAFRQVSAHYGWDAIANCWVGAVPVDHPGVSAAFQRQLERAPVRLRNDRRLLARLLAEIALADGETTGEERALLEHVLGDSVTIRPITDVHPGVPLTPVELATATAGPVRETMLALAWSLALCDGLKPEEVQRLNKVATILEVPEPRERALRQAAAELLFEQRLERIHAEEVEAERVAERIRDAALALELDPHRAERLGALYRQLNAWRGDLASV